MLDLWQSDSAGFRFARTELAQRPKTGRAPKMRATAGSGLKSAVIYKWVATLQLLPVCNFLGLTHIRKFRSASAESDSVEACHLNKEKHSWQIS